MLQNYAFPIILYEQRGYISVRKFHLILTQLFNVKNRKDRICRQKIVMSSMESFQIITNTILSLPHFTFSVVKT